MENNEWIILFIEYILYIKYDDYGRKTKHNITSQMSKNNAAKTVTLIRYLKLYIILSFL